MWLQYYQPLVTDLVQKALVQLCNDHVPHNGKLEIDGLVCISDGNLDKQIVVKVHEIIGTGRNEQSSGSAARPKGHILQVPGFKRRSEGQENVELVRKQPKIETQTSPRSMPLNLSQNTLRDSNGTHQANNKRAEEISANKDLQASKDPKRMSISLLKLLSSDQPSGGLKISTASQRSESASPQRNRAPPQPKVVSPSSSRECSPVSDAVLSGKDIRCKICSISVQSVQQLVSHTSEIHKRYLCKHCLNSFSLRCNLHRHERLHSGIKPFPCNKCGKSFARNADLKLHLQKHDSATDDEPANTTCQRCSKVFLNMHSLRYHLFKVHRVQDGIHACTICEKVFDDEEAYNKHWESHTDSLVQHGQIKVTLRPKGSDESGDDDDEESREDGGEKDENNLEEADFATSETGTSPSSKEYGSRTPRSSSSKIHKSVTYKSLLQPKFKPIATAKDADGDEQGEVRVKMEPNRGSDDGFAYEKKGMNTSLSDSNIPGNTAAQGPTHSDPGIDFDAIKKEFGPLFHYNEVSTNGMDSEPDTEGMDFSLSKSFSIPSMVNSREASPAFTDNIPSSSSRSKRKSRPFKHITGLEDLQAESPGSRDGSEQSLSSVRNVSTSKKLMSGATIIQVNSDDRIMQSRENSPMTLLDDDRSIPSAHKLSNAVEKVFIKMESETDSPSATPKAKLKPLPALDKEPQGSPSAEALADDDAEYECRYGGCGQRFVGFKSYEDHFFSAHGRFPCKLCEQSFTCKNNRTRHVRNHLGIAKRHPCDRCSKTFTRPDTLQEHKFIHTQSYKADHCNGCGATFDRKALLLAHMKKCFRNKPELLEKDMLDSLSISEGEKA